MNIITGYRGTPHITSAQDRGKNQGIFGSGSYVLNVGQKMAAEIVSANEVRIRDGVLSHQGCVSIIEQGTYDSVEISNGSQGMKRIDLIVARYEKEAETNVESMTLEVIEGTAVSGTPEAPSYNEGDIQAGDNVVDMPLYHVNIDGVNITSLTSVFATVIDANAVNAKLGNKNISSIGDGTVTGAISTLNANLANTKFVKYKAVTVNLQINGKGSIAQSDPIQFPNIAGYTRMYAVIVSVSGTGSGSCILTLHGFSEIVVYAASTIAEQSTLRVDIKLVYFKTSNLELIT